MTDPILAAIAPDGDAHATLQLAITAAQVLDRPLLLGAVAVPNDAVPGAPVVAAFVQALEPDELQVFARRQLEALLPHVPDGVAVDSVVVTAATAGAGLEYLARHHDPALVVLGATHRSALSRVVVQDPTLEAVRRLPCPVLVAPAGDGAERSAAPAAPAVIGVAWDRSPESRAALQFAGQFAERAGAELRVLHVLEPALPVFVPPADPMVGHELTASREAQARADIDAAIATLVPPACHAAVDVREGRLGFSVERFSATVDLLVIGSHQATALERMLAGSLSEHLAHRARCPIMVVPRTAQLPASSGSQAA